MGRAHGVAEISQGRGLHQIEGAAAKSPAGHARANQARLRNGNFHHQIEFSAADLIIVPETAMRVLKQWSQGCGVSSVKCFDRALHTRVFCNDVAAPSENPRSQSSPMSFQLGKCNVTKRASLGEHRPYTSTSRFALRAAGI